MPKMPSQTAKIITPAATASVARIFVVKFTELRGGRWRAAGFKLQGVELEIVPAPLNQFVMRPDFNHPALVQHHNLVGALDGRKPVRDANRGATLHQFLQCRLNYLFDLGVQ